MVLGNYRRAGRQANSKDKWSPQIGDPESVYENKYFQILRVQADFGAFAKEYFVVESGVRSGIVAWRGDSLLMVQQYRLLIDGLSWEIPGGRVDDGETPEAAAVRECLEETGMRCLSPRLLLSYHVGLDMINNPTHIFYSEEVSGHHEPDSIHEQEVSGYDWFSLDRCFEMISNGELKDHFTMLAIFAYQKLRNGRQDQPNK